MSQQNDSGFKTFTANGAIAINALVRQTTTGITTCGITDRAIGTATQAALAADDEITVKLITASGTHRVIANAALAAGADAYTAASGKVGASASTAYRIFMVLEASAADGDVIEAIYLTDGAAVS